MITDLKACRNPLSKLLKETAIKWPNVPRNVACSRSRTGFLPGADCAAELFSKEERNCGCHQIEYSERIRNELLK
jgi:hypothetical protein